MSFPSDERRMSLYRYILAFGSNLGNRDLNCQRGQDHLAKVGRCLRRSRSLYTEPLKSEEFEVEENQAFFLNYIIEFESSLSPKELYTHIVVIEDEVGHDRSRKWASRHLDIDILFVEGAILDEEDGLVIPHRDLKNRPFLLELLSDFA
jgi:2-amino-4-hydroxy-6-hydroxymethyldihydropteridine diphosphokinase